MERWILPGPDDAEHGVNQEAPGGSRGTPGANTSQRATQIRERPTARCPRASARGFLSNVRQAGWHDNTSPRRKPGDSGRKHQPTCHADPGTPNRPVSPGFRPGLFVKRAPGRMAGSAPAAGGRPRQGRQDAEPCRVVRSHTTCRRRSGSGWRTRTETADRSRRDIRSRSGRASRFVGLSMPSRPARRHSRPSRVPAARCH